MRILPLALGALLFAVPAKADKFWLTNPDEAVKPVAGSIPHYIEGVLLGEDADVYTVRIVGGEIQLPKKAVFKVEKDGLTVEKIAETEKQDAARLAKVRAEQKPAAGPRRRSDVSAAEASARRNANAAEASLPPVFDPVVGRALPVVTDADAQRDLKEAWRVTRDRDYLTALRQLRRSR